jgi:hypothetical protein
LLLAQEPGLNPKLNLKAFCFFINLLLNSRTFILCAGMFGTSKAYNPNRCCLSCVRKSQTVLSLVRHVNDIYFFLFVFECLNTALCCTLLHFAEVVLQTVINNKLKCSVCEIHIIKKIFLY